ncbi:MAG: helix-turn-helix domain-containing protein [Acholeplasmataceae bacterium]|jgi:IclR family KDG regulon transcriptional repressor
MKDNRSVVRVLDILELIAKHEEGLTLGQIYRTLNIPKATAYDVLQTLYKYDAIYYRDPNLKNYVIGSKMFAIGSVYTKNSNFIEASSHDLKDYANTYNKTVFGTKRIKDKVVYVFKYQSPKAHLNTKQEIGTIVYDLNSDISGITYLLFDKKDPEIIAKYQKYYDNGFLIIRSNDNLNILSIAAPIYNFENRVCGVLVTTGIQDEDNEISKDSIRDFLVISRSTSRKLGYIGDFK